MILGITKRDHWTNEEVLEKTGMCEVGELVTRSRLRWLGHVVRMGEDRLPPRVLYGELEGKGKKGRPAGRWKDMIAGDIKRWHCNVHHERRFGMNSPRACVLFVVFVWQGAGW